MRILVNDVAILERARLGFVGVADQIDRLFFVGLDEAPFHAAGKTRAAAAAQTRSFHFVDDLRARHRDRFLQLLVTAVAEVAIDVCGPIVASDVFENQTVFEGMRELFDVRSVGWISEKIRAGIGVYVFVQTRR